MESVERPRALTTDAGIVVLTELVDVFAGLRCDILSVFLPVGCGVDILRAHIFCLKRRITSEVILLKYLVHV